MSSCGHHKQTVAFVLNRNTDGSEVFRERTALLREFLAGLTKPGDETVTLFADGRAVEIPVFCSGLQVPPNRVSQRSTRIDVELSCVCPKLIARLPRPYVPWGFSSPRRRAERLFLGAK
jgi:hypothetical protein